MRLATVLLAALALAPTRLRAECQPSDEIVRVRISLKPANNLELAGFVMSVTYPADQLTIPGRGKDAESAVSKTPEATFTGADNRDGEIRLVVAKGKALGVDPVCEITFHRCRGAKKPPAGAVRCKLMEASDPSRNKIDIDEVACLVGPASVLTKPLSSSAPAQ